jgi:hypothetical protein
MTASEQSPVMTMAAVETRLAETKAVRNALWPDRDDPRVLSELVGLQSTIRELEGQCQAA